MTKYQICKFNTSIEFPYFLTTENSIKRSTTYRTVTRCKERLATDRMVFAIEDSYVVIETFTEESHPEYFI